jgi:hypothetical protein
MCKRRSTRRKEEGVAAERGQGDPRTGGVTSQHASQLNTTAKHQKALLPGEDLVTTWCQIATARFWHHCDTVDQPYNMTTFYATATVECRHPSVKPQGTLQETLTYL